jgi:crotonobetainyl-CoA:carnitine CoA-transferase CaiB-like acyl-CoA transferase
MINKENLPLKGIRVLDLCIVLAGPTCGRTLAQYGAEVIKIDPEHRPPSLTPWLDVGRGKKSICLNITKPGGLNVFLKMANTADVIIDGFRKGVTKKLGIDYQTLSKNNPRLIYGSINCFGHNGPWKSRPGFEQNAQAATGIQIRNGGANLKPRQATFTLNDYGTGLAAAYGIILALLERNKTGFGQEIEASLVSTSTMLSAGLSVDYDGYQKTDIGGPGLRGSSINNRLYETQNGWIFVNVSLEKLWGKLLLQNKKNRSEIEKLFLKNTTEHWLNILSKIGIQAVKHVVSDDIYSNVYNHERGMIVTKHYSPKTWGTATWSGNPVSVSNARQPSILPQKFGEDTIQILTDLGISQSEINFLQISGAIPRKLPISLS